MAPDQKIQLEGYEIGILPRESESFKTLDGLMPAYTIYLVIYYDYSYQMHDVVLMF